MPAWSDEIANQFIRCSLANGTCFTQMHLQELVYIAHGWCLALTGQPLTGDRPEAQEHGPEYRRLSDALVRCGVKPVVAEICTSFPDPEFDATELQIMEKIYVEYARLKTAQLGVLTRSSGTPWELVYASGAGIGRDISHAHIKAQFAEISAELCSTNSGPHLTGV